MGKKLSTKHLRGLMSWPALADALQATFSEAEADVPHAGPDTLAQLGRLMVALGTFASLRVMQAKSAKAGLMEMARQEGEAADCFHQTLPDDVRW